MENTKWIIPQLAKRYNFRGYVLTDWKEMEDKDVHYFSTLINGSFAELKVETDKKGHWTIFEVWQKMEAESELDDAGDWEYLEAFEVFI